MNKQTIAAAESKKKPYAKPQIQVIEVEGAELICQSGGTEGLEGEDFPWYRG